MEMIKDVDKSTVVSCRLIDIPVLGPISVKELSGCVDVICDVPCKETCVIADGAAIGPEMNRQTGGAEE